MNYSLNGIIEFLKKFNGFRTHICVSLLIITGIINYFGVIDPEMYQLLLSVLGPLALAALRSGAQKAEAEVVKTQFMIEILNKKEY